MVPRLHQKVVQYTGNSRKHLFFYCFSRLFHHSDRILFFITDLCPFLVSEDRMNARDITQNVKISVKRNVSKNHKHFGDVSDAIRATLIYEIYLAANTKPLKL